MFWFNDVEKQLSGSARDCYVAARARISSMKRWCPEREAVPAIVYKKSRGPAYDDDHNELIEETPQVLAVLTINWR